MSADTTVSQPAASRRIGTAIGRILSFALTLVITLVGLTAVTFFISRLTNIDPVISVIGDRANQATYDKVFLELGLDKPPIVQYLIYLKRLVSGDFGMSVLTSQPVLTPRVPRKWAN